MNRKLIASTLSALLLGAPSLSSAALTHIGAAAAVKGMPKAQSQGEAVGRIIQSGKPLFLNDHVTTDASSRFQVLLKDQTVFTLGPNSDMVLDTFVYDPETEKGQISATITKGVFRFVTGKIANNQPSNMKVKLPVGTIGIRGTIVAGIVSPTMCAVMLAGPGAGNNANAKTGAFELSNAMGSTNVNVAGEGSMIPGPGQAPTPPGPLPAATIGEINAGLSAAPTSGTSEEASAGSGASSSSSTQPDEEPASSTESSAAEESGDTTAAGGESAEETGVSTELNSTAQNSSTQSSQDNTRVSAGITEGLAHWGQVRGVTSFTGWFFNVASVSSCTGCQSNPQVALQLWVDFANKTLGGTGSFNGPEGGSNSFIHLHNIFSPGDTVQSLINSMSYSSTSSFPDASDAKYSPSLAAVTGCGAGTCTFSGTQIQLNNKNGVVAAEAQANYQFTNSSGVSASGTIIAPR